MNPPKAWNTKLEAASFFYLLKAYATSVSCTTLIYSQWFSFVSFMTFSDFQSLQNNPLYSQCLSMDQIKYKVVLFIQFLIGILNFRSLCLNCTTLGSNYLPGSSILMVQKLWRLTEGWFNYKIFCSLQSNICIGFFWLWSRGIKTKCGNKVYLMSF